MISPSRFDHARMLDRASERTVPDTWTDRSRKGMVATSHYLATAAGSRMLALGGNAADAAVAASLALGVCEPAGSGLGGMAMALVHWHQTGETFALPGPCRAPRGASPEILLASKRYRGYRAVAVPGNVAVLDVLHHRHGLLGRDTVSAPAIRYAREGFPITPMQEELIRHYRGPLKRGSAGALFLNSERMPLARGTLLCQPTLASTLERMASAGFRDFYSGAIAHDLASDMRRMDGLVTLEDLEEFPSPEPVPPLRCRFGNLDVYTMPPPGGGTALIQMLNMFDAIAEASFDPDSGDGCHLLAELIRQSRRDRVRYRLKIGAEEVGGAADLIDPDYARTRAETIRVRIPGTGETSHISVADRHGNMVSMTQSIERSFGAAEISPSLGFLCNGFLRAFKIRNRQHPHFLSPGTPARSNACPTVVLDGTEPWCAVGNTGSERLASGILQVLARLRSQSPFESVLAPRIHATPERILMYEDRLQPGALHRLGEAGYRLERHGPYSFKFGGLNLVVRQQDAFVGVAEPRRDGTAAGPEAWPSSVVDSQAD